MAELADAVHLTSCDPALDLLLVRFHLETGARRQGALNLRADYLATRRSSPPSMPTTATAATERRRRALPHRRRNPDHCAPHDTLFGRARAALGWDLRSPVSAHVLRTPPSPTSPDSPATPPPKPAPDTPRPPVTGRYIHATLAEVAAAVAVLTGEPHPLAASTAPHTPSCRRRR